MVRSLPAAHIGRRLGHRTGRPATQGTYV